MGTPEMDIYQAMDFFAEIGLEGIEVRCAENGQMHLETITDDEVARIREHAQKAGIAFACLTPYYRDFMTPDAAESTLADYELACRIAQELDCPTVRAISGTWPQEGGAVAAGSDRLLSPGHERAEVFEKTAAGLRLAADLAADHGVRLAVETHRGQLAFSAAETVEFVEAVNHPALGVLWDHYWVHVAGQEDAQEALELLAPHLVHVHAKNIRFHEDGSHETVLLDEGELDWCEIVAGLASVGYDGYISDEYEKFWKPDLPEPEVGMKRNAEVLRDCLGRLR